MRGGGAASAVFSASDADHGRELWALSAGGSALGAPYQSATATLLVDSVSGGESGAPTFFYPIGDSLTVFVASASTGGPPVLWATDGSSACVLNASAWSTQYLIAFRDHLVFAGTAVEGGSATSLLSIPLSALTDPTFADLCAAALPVAAASTASPAPAAPAELTTCGPWLFFAAEDPDDATSRALWRWDSAAAAAPAVVPLVGGHSLPPLVAGDVHAAFLTCTNGSAALALVSDSGAVLVVDVRSGESHALAAGDAYTGAARLIRAGDGVCFAALTAVHRQQLLCVGVSGGGLDNVAAVPSIVLAPTSFQTLSFADAPAFFAVYRSKLYLPCFLDGAGPLLCVIDTNSWAVTAPAGTGLELRYGSFTGVGDAVFFGARRMGSSDPEQLWAIAA